MTTLKPGVEAPDFTTTALDGKAFNLRALRGSKVWLAFYRYAKCPLCNLYISKTVTKIPTLSAQGLKMVAIFESRPELFPKDFIAMAEPRILISDPDKNLYRKYEVQTKLGAALHPGAIMMWFEASGKGFKQPMPDGAMEQVPGHFLINERGVVEYAKYGMHIGDHVAIDKVEAFVNGAGQDALAI